MWLDTPLNPILILQSVLILMIIFSLCPCTDDRLKRESYPGARPIANQNLIIMGGLAPIQIRPEQPHCRPTLSDLAETALNELGDNRYVWSMSWIWYLINLKACLLDKTSWFYDSDTCSGQFPTFIEIPKFSLGPNIVHNPKHKLNLNLIATLTLIPYLWQNEARIKCNQSQCWVTFKFVYPPNDIWKSYRSQVNNLCHQIMLIGRSKWKYKTKGEWKMRMNLWW